MKISIINKIEDLLLIKEDWDRLFIKGDYSVFQSFDFNYGSWKHEFISDKRNQLAITVITIKRSVIGIFPFYIDSKKRLRFINDIHSDFCDFITDKSIDLSEILLYLKQEMGFRSIKLINLKQEANICKLISELNVKNKVVLSSSEYSFLSVDKGVFPYNVSHYRSHQKHRINKAANKHKDKKAQILSVDKHEFPKKDLLVLKEKMISLGIRKKNFLTNEKILLIEFLYNTGIVIINRMKKDNKIISINILLKNSPHEFIFWIDLFDDLQMINIASYISFISVSSLESSIDVNFGRGRYFYKTSNFSPEFHPLYAIYIFPNIWKRLRFIISEESKKYLKSVYKKLLK